MSLGRRANRALLPRCVPRFARSRRAIRCETPCGTPLLRKPRRRAERSESGEARSHSSALRLSLRSSLACSDMPRCALVPAHAQLRRSIFPRLSERLRPVSLLASGFHRSRSPSSPPCSAAAQSRHYGRSGLNRSLGRMRPPMGGGSSTHPLSAAVFAYRRMALGACRAIRLLLIEAGVKDYLCGCALSFRASSGSPLRVCAVGRFFFFSSGRGEREKNRFWSL